MITRTSLANEIDEYDQQIADMNSGKKDCFDSYRAQLIASGMDKANIKTEIEAVKAAIKRRRLAKKDPTAVEEKDALIEEIFEEITTSARAPRATRENIEKFDPKTGEVFDRDARARRRMSESMDDHKSLVDEMADLGMISEEARAENKALADAVARKFGNGPITPSDAAPRLDNTVSPDSAGEVAPTHGLPTNSKIAPASQGEAEAPAPMNVSLPDDDERSCEGANAGDCPDEVNQGNAQPDNGPGFVNTSRAKTIRDYRPNCLKPEACASNFIDRHCHSCERVSRNEVDA